MKIIKLDVREDSELEGIDAVALVENPAIEIDFQAFAKHEFQSFDDYPQAARKAAEQGIKRNEALGNKCGTQVGKVRAQQLAQGKPVSLDTIKRMRAFLIRQRDNYDLAVKRQDYNACGYISYLLWGGPDALPWAEKKLRQAGLLEASNEQIIRDEFAELQGFVDNAGGFSVGDFVSWTFAGRGDDADRGRGQIEDIRIQGEVTIPDSSFVFKPTKERPLAIIRTRQGKLVGQYTENLRKIQKPDDFEKYFDDLSSDKQELLLKALDNVGLTQDNLEADGWVEMSEDAFHNHLYFAIVSEPEKGSLQDTAQFKVLYKYEGPRDSKNRTFCREVLNKNLLYRIEDINNMSLQGENQEFGTYDIFSYKGSYNCRHRWVQKFYRREKPVEEQKRSVVNLIGPKAVIGGPRAQEASQTNPKSRTKAEVEAGVEAGLFEFSAIQGEEQVLVGPLMIPDKLIPRLDENGEKYYVFFDAEGIKRLSYKMIINKLIDSVNIEHDPSQKVKDATLVESWLIEDPNYDKAAIYGYDLPKGTWMAKYKIKDKGIWDEYVKTGRVKGFSVEGIFSDKIIMASANEDSE